MRFLEWFLTIFALQVLFMKLNKNIVFTLLALTVVAALYRILPNRPFGFEPQTAIALFAGSIIKDKKYAFALPLLSMLISDTIYQALFSAGLTAIPGFYSGQFVNYLLFAGLTVVGFFVNSKNVWQIGLGALTAPTLYFLASNFLVWIGGGGYHHPKTIAGLLQTYVDGVPFYGMGIYSTLVFSAVFFGGYALLKGKELKTA